MSPQPQFTESLDAAALAHYQYNAYEFVKYQILWNVRKEFQISWQQKQALDAISKYEKVGIRSGHGTGKSAFEAWIAIWFLITRPSPCRVPCTAPTGHQLHDVLWMAISRWLSISLIKADLTWMKTEVRHKTHGEAVGGEHYALARTSNKPDNMQGQHAPHMLWLIDEAYGIMDPIIWDVIIGSMTQGDNKLVFAGNPTVVTGYAHDAFHRDKNLWVPPFGALLTFDAEQSPLTNKEKIKRDIAKWGENSDYVRVRIRGLPPLGNPDAFITLSSIEEAIGRENVKDGPIEIGVDCARFGNDLTTIVVRKGFKVFPIRTFSRTDEIQIYEHIINTVREIRGALLYKERIRIKIDNTGGYGAGAYDKLKRNTEDNIEAIAINFAGAGNDEYADVPSVMWGELRNVMGQISLPDDPDMVAELSSRLFKFVDIDGREKVRIEPKENFKKRHGSSPDHADALTLCFTNGAIAKTVWDFFPTDLDYIVKIKPKWGALSQNVIPLVSVWTERNMETSVLVCLWHSVKMKLFILGERVFQNAQTEITIPALTLLIREISEGVVHNLKDFQWFGNKAFFADKIGDMKSLYMKYGIFIRENEHYDESGAILFIARLIFKKALALDERIGSLQYQMSEWNIKQGAPADGYGLCRALCLMASSLNEAGYTQPQTPMFQDYSTDKTQYNEHLRKLAEQDKLNEIGKPAQTLHLGKDDWMVQ